ncbi:MAG: radical SAM protein [Theionarchaea archaeon]|nr:radical SAM protein [Theionarchaea archaeon]
MCPVCEICGESRKVSDYLGLCAACIQKNPEEALKHCARVHSNLKREFSQPDTPPHAGIPCGCCVNDCSIAHGSQGYCGVRMNYEGKIMATTRSPTTAYVECYYDWLPTNCVAMEFCGEKSTTGKKNLAVFYGSCTFNCLFCQNWQYRLLEQTMTVKDVLDWVDERTACICNFGGDPTPQITHALEVARQSDVRICWETNGAFSQDIAHRVGKAALDSGGTVKIDVKAFSGPLNYALTGSSNTRTLSNCEYLWNTFQRSDPPILVVSTLLVPGYVEKEEVTAIAQFLAGIDADIPYCLLAFHPHFKMKDLPFTSRDQALSCCKAAESYLNRVRLGNTHLLT